MTDGTTGAGTGDGGGPDDAGRRTGAPGPAEAAEAAEPAEPAERAHVHVVRGAPDDVELAALVAGLAAVAVTDDDPEHAPRSAWSDRSRGLRGPRTPPSAGADAWRWSLRG